VDINVVGVGVTGFATAEVLRRLGHKLRVYDSNPARQAELEESGYLPIAMDKGELTFFCVPEWNLMEALTTGPKFGLWVVRSSTRPGDVRALQDTFSRHIVHLPEFLREASALQDALTPDRIVIGECCSQHGTTIEGLFAPLLAPIIRVDPVTSEMVKLVSNAHLCTLISFWNEVHSICERAQVNSTAVGKLVSMDHRISKYGAVMHGRPFAGFCLPKDLDSMIGLAKLLSLNPSLLAAVREVNMQMGGSLGTHAVHQQGSLK